MSERKRVNELATSAAALDAPASTTPEWPVAEAARRTGLSIDTLRYYEKLGLIDPVARTAGGKRLYSDLDLDRIRFVRRLRATGMPIDTIAEYVRLRAAGPPTASRRLTLLRAHREELARQQAELAEHVAALEQKIAYYEDLTGGDHE